MIKEIPGFEVLYTGSYADGTQEQYTLCASESGKLCREWMRKEVAEWIKNGWEIVSETPNRIVLSLDRQGIATHEVLSIHILK